VKRTPVHVVTGSTADDRKALIANFLAAKSGWRAFAPRGCPCCTGRVETQVGLARLLREAAPDRVLLELPDPQHLPALERALGEWPLARYVEPRRVIKLPEDAAMAPETLGP
jgi:hypothetical protein